MLQVIVPVDFSETSSTAVRFGTNLAELLGFDLHVVHVSDLVLSGKHSLTTPEQKRDEIALGERLAEFTRENVAQILLTNRGRVAVTPKVSQSIRSGMATEQILALSRQTTTALIVMGGVGTGAGITLPGVYGSVATPVATRSACPVILIPKGHDAVAVERLAIAFDDADEIIRIGQFARNIVKALRPEVRYVHVTKVNWREEIETQDDFMDLTWGKGFPSYSFKFDVLPVGNVVESLLAYVKDEEIGLLVLGGKRHGFWQRLFTKG
ncbi:MAG: universal stress protein, partial [Bacteroidota bacterium]